MQRIPGPRVPTYSNPYSRRLRRRGLLLSGTVGLLVVAILFAPAGLRAFAMWFRVDTPAPADAIVLLLGGMGNRPQWAAKLYRQGLAPVILMGRGVTYGQSSQNESDDTKEILIEEGVPADAIRILPAPPLATSTRNEALAFRAYAESHPLKRIVLVSTSCHTRRCCWVFRRELAGTGIDIRAAAAPDLRFDESNWYRSDEGLVAYFEELIKTVYYWVAY